MANSSSPPSWKGNVCLWFIVILTLTTSFIKWNPGILHGIGGCQRIKIDRSITPLLIPRTNNQQQNVTSNIIQPQQQQNITTNSTTTTQQQQPLILVIGASAGIGQQLVNLIADLQNNNDTETKSKLYTTGRSLDRALKAVNENAKEYLMKSYAMELAVNHSIDDFTTTLIHDIKNHTNLTNPTLDLIFLHAGDAPDYSHDPLPDGSTGDYLLKVNFVSHARLLKRLLPIIGDDTHIIFTSSIVHYGGDPNDIIHPKPHQAKGNFEPYLRYATSKLAVNVLQQELARKGLKTFAAIPGAVASNFFTKIRDMNLTIHDVPRSFQPVKHLMYLPHEGATYILNAALAALQNKLPCDAIASPYWNPWGKIEQWFTSHFGDFIQPYLLPFVMTFEVLLAQRITADIDHVWVCGTAGMNAKLREVVMKVWESM
jgi:NAD(P)-dependent dehydrogenase (short-subunit alcohol dehydrogenase family)